MQSDTGPPLHVIESARLSADREAARLAQLRSRDDIIRNLFYLVICLGLMVILLSIAILIRVV